MVSSVLEAVNAALAQESQIGLREKQEEAEQGKKFFLNFLREHFPFYWEQMSRAFTQATPLWLNVSELGLERFLAIELRGFILALDVRRNDNRQVIVLAEEGRPDALGVPSQVLGVVTISADKSGEEFLSPADRQLSEILLRSPLIKAEKRNC